MRPVSLKSGATIPAFGLGTWRMGEEGRVAKDEIAALKLGLDLGVTLIDTAEMYGEGGAEEVVAQAVVGRRDSVYLVSKVYPHNASRAGVQAACERSLKRLKTDRLELYLLHWAGSYPLSETVAGFEALRKQGKIRDWGVSNFDVDDMAELADVPDGKACASNQVLYHLGERGIEWQLLPECQRNGMMVMAYSPLGQGAILKVPPLVAIAAKHSVTPAAIALAFLLEQPGVVVIPKATSQAHVRANVAALAVQLDAEDRAALAKAFPPPKKRVPLGML
jgi:diketogulonate reductase-like aldo/keto reductase